MNKEIEALFENFLNAAPTGELAEDMHTISAMIDRQIEAGKVDADTIGEYELAATRYGFYAGFVAALEYQRAKVQLALQRRQERLQGAA